MDYFCTFRAVEVPVAGGLDVFLVNKVRLEFLGLDGRRALSNLGSFPACRT